MLALRLPAEIEKRLDALAKVTGRTKSFYAREAILRHIEDMEDEFVALQRIREDDGVRYPLEQIKAEFANDPGFEGDPEA